MYNEPLIDLSSSGPSLQKQTTSNVRRGRQGKQMAGQNILSNENEDDLLRFNQIQEIRQRRLTVQRGRIMKRKEVLKIQTNLAQVRAKEAKNVYKKMVGKINDNELRNQYLNYVKADA